VPFDVQMLIGFAAIYFTADILQLFFIYLAIVSFLSSRVFIYYFAMEMTVQKYEANIQYISYISVNTNGDCISSQILRTLFVQ